MPSCASALFAALCVAHRTHRLKKGVAFCIKFQVCFERLTVYALEDRKKRLVSMAMRGKKSVNVDGPLTCMFSHDESLIKFHLETAC